MWSYIKLCSVLWLLVVSAESLAAQQGTAILAGRVLDVTNGAEVITAYSSKTTA